MKKILSILQFYNFIVTLSLLIIGILRINTARDILLAVILIPLTWYFGVVSGKKIPIIKRKIPNKTYKLTTKIVFAYGSIISIFLLVALFLNIRTFNDLFLILFLSPLTFYFLLELISKKKYLKVKNKEKSFERIFLDEISSNSLPVLQPIPVNDNSISEKERRAFLKLIAGAGFGFLVTAMINPQKAGAAFFGSVPGPGVISLKDTDGTKIDPAIKSPTDGYGIMNIDTTATPYYYGFVNKDGAWYIVKEVGDGSFLYAKGSSGYNWNNRASESYASYSSTF